MQNRGIVEKHRSLPYGRALFPDEEAFMQVLSLAWVGTRTAEHDATVAFFSDVLGLSVHSAEPDFTVLEVPGGATVEVFGPGSDFNRHLTHPVAGFRVDDIDAAARELAAAGVEIVLPHRAGGDRSWLHFRAPDGFVYELMEDRSDHATRQPS